MIPLLSSSEGVNNLWTGKVAMPPQCPKYTSFFLQATHISLSILSRASVIYKLWGFKSTVCSFYKSRHGFMGIYITNMLRINPHKYFCSPATLHSLCSDVKMKRLIRIYEDLWGFISPNKFS